MTRITGELARQFLAQLAELERARGVRLNTIGDRLQERFIKPLALDRLRALVEPAIQESQQGGNAPSFIRLQEELQAYTATPTGVGLDVPAWLRSLEAEVHRVLATRSTLAVLAESFERIHRSNLVGMGVLPLEFLAGETPASLGLTGQEIFEIDGLAQNFEPRKKMKVRAKDTAGKVKEFTVLARVDTPFEVAYYKNGGILHYVLRQMV